MGTQMPSKLICMIYLVKNGLKGPFRRQHTGARSETRLVAYESGPDRQSARRDATSPSAEKSFFGIQPGHDHAQHRSNGGSAENAGLRSVHDVVNNLADSSF